MTAETCTTMPARRRYKRAAISALPFMSPKRDNRLIGFRDFWQVPPTDDYVRACEVGREYAAHFVQYMKDNPGAAGENTLGHIAAAIDFSDGSRAKGYWVGFFSHLERLIYEQTQKADVFAESDRISARCEVLAAGGD